MRHELLIHLPGAAPAPLALAAPCTAGGSRADGILLPGLPPRAVALAPCPAGVVVEAATPGVHVGGHPVPPGGRRLLRAGERAELHGAALELPPRPPAEGTRAAAAALLRDAAAGAIPVAGPHLVVVTGPAAGARLPLGADQTLGRGRSATLRLHDPEASRVHARIRLGADGASVEDLRSKNGVRLNGVRIDRRPVPLRPGDALRIGETELALEAESPLPRAGPPPAPERRVAAPRARLAAAALLALCAAALALGS